MRVPSILVICVLAIGGLAAQQPPATPYAPKQSDRPEAVTGDEPGFQPIFDGKTLAGWEGNPTYWRVENGALVGEITPATVIKSNTFIIWRGGKPKDFELKLDYRITRRGNSGINYRSVVVPDPVTPANKFAMRGYQCDLDGRKRYPGNNYEEKGRLFLAVRGQMTRVVGGRPPVLALDDRRHRRTGAGRHRRLERRAPHRPRQRATHMINGRADERRDRRRRAEPASRRADRRAGARRTADESRIPEHPAEELVAPAAVRARRSARRNLIRLNIRSTNHRPSATAISAGQIGRRSVRRSACRRRQARPVSARHAPPVAEAIDCSSVSSAARKRYSAAGSGRITRDGHAVPFVASAPASVTVSRRVASATTVALVAAGRDLADRHVDRRRRPAACTCTDGSQQIAIAAARVARLDRDRDRARRAVDRSGGDVERHRRRPLPLERADDRGEERAVAAPGHPARRPAILDVRREHRRPAEPDRPERQQRIVVGGREHLERRVLEHRRGPPLERAACA